MPQPKEVIKGTINAYRPKLSEAKKKCVEGLIGAKKKCGESFHKAKVTYDELNRKMDYRNINREVCPQCEK
jgi:hypothetical protein